MNITKLKFAIFLLVVLTFCRFEAAYAASANVELSTGFRSDSLDWTIAGNLAGSNPNILSELKWDDLESFQLAARAELSRPLRATMDGVLTGQMAYGWILSGNNRDSDYAGDNRTLEWSRSENDAGDGHVLDLVGGVGLRFSLPDQRWFLTPLFGYAYFEQDLVMRNGLQTVSEPGIATANGYPTPPPVGPIEGLDSSYYAWWFGPWIGLQAEYRQNRQTSWDFLLRWHRLDFRAEADWNLRTDLQHPVSFEHEADGDGLTFAIGYDYRWAEKCTIGADFSYADMTTDAGLDIVYFSSGAIGATRLNEVNHQAWSLSLSYRYYFR